MDNLQGNELLELLRGRKYKLLDDWLSSTCGVKMIEIETLFGESAILRDKLMEKGHAFVIGTIAGLKSLVLFIKESDEGTLFLQKLI